MHTKVLPTSQFDVVIVGAGCAGLSAAIGLAKAGFRTAVLEAAVYPGAENWSGCVYFCENLAHPELLGPEAVAELAWERRLVQRGTYICNGKSLLGVTYRDPDAFRHCYTVLRPVFDHHLGLLAQRHGVVLLTQTTAESLLRDDGRVIGVSTQRGPLYADLVFLAEGDASHLVSREGYEQLPAGQAQPKFLHGIKQILDLPPEALERNFGLKPTEGAACEIILRNARLHGKQLKLNMGGFIYTNQASLSIGLVLPADHLHEHFSGDPNLLIEWFENLPDLKPWFRDSVRGVFGAKLIRGGGAREFPRMVDDGLAIGGAASGVGVDFPYPNYTGPATRMGLQLVRAAKAIRKANGDFTAKELREHYLEPLKSTRYWQDVEFLRDWPGYVEATKVFFDQQVDLILGSAFVLAKDGTADKEKWRQVTDLVLSQTHGAQLEAIRRDQRHLKTALPVPKVFTPPPLPLLLLDGGLNVLRDWLGKPRAGVPTTGELNLHYSVLGESAGASQPPAELLKVFHHIKPGLAAAAREIYLNDDTPLPKKVNGALRKLAKQLHLGSILLAGRASARQLLRLLDLVRGKAVPPPQLDAATEKLVQEAVAVPDLTPLVPQAAHKWEDRLGRLGYLTDPRSHIHLRYPVTFQASAKIADAGLWHVCPAHVYEARVSPLGQLQLVVNYENCIKCETCWRTSDLVDWGRDGHHRFVYAVNSPAQAKLIGCQQSAPFTPLAQPYRVDAWDAERDKLTDQLANEHVNGVPGTDAASVAQLATLARQLSGKLGEFGCALAAEPRTIDTPRADYLLILAQYAQKLGHALGEGVRGSGWSTSPHTSVRTAQQALVKWTGQMLPRLVKMVEMTAAGRFSWAAAEGRHVQQHQLAGITANLEALAARWPMQSPVPPTHQWLQAEAAAKAISSARLQLRERLDDVWGPYLWRDLDQGAKLTPSQEAAFKAVVAEAIRSEASSAGSPLHSPQRKMVLEELARRDASLGFRASRHLLAHDLLSCFVPDWLEEHSGWLAFATLVAGRIEEGQISGTAIFVPAADRLVLAVGSRLCLFSAAELAEYTTQFPTLGLRGAGLVELAIDRLPISERSVEVDPRKLEHLLTILEAADLIAIAHGMASLWTERCVTHAASRVQFPGLFHDERSRDTIGKFGAVKKMLAEMAAATLAIETLSYNFCPTEATAPTAQRMRLAKAVVGQLLGTAPGSLGYNAGQIFGGTGYSEDDILSKAFRDSAAWRFLGGTNPEIFVEHGAELKSPSRFDGEVDHFATLRSRSVLEPLLRVIDALDSEIACRLTGKPGPAEAEARGRLDAFLLASKALLLRLHARHEEFLGSENVHALVEVFLLQLRRWADEWLSEGHVPHHLDVAFDIGDYTPETDYLRFTKTPLKTLPAGTDESKAKKLLAYSTGDYLASPLDLRLPRYVPELIETDTRLRDTDSKFNALVLQQFGQEREGLRFERYIEAQHLPDDADLDFCREHGFFRMPIPPTLGGEGKLKAEYYSLVMQLNQFADPTMSLLVQANTSIGTSPILLARDKDLPKAIKDLKPFVTNEALHEQIAGRLKALEGQIVGSETGAAQRTLQELEPLVEPILRAPALKGQIYPFADAWKTVSRAVAVGDWKRATAKLTGWVESWHHAVAAATALLAELELRMKACDLGLRWIASGQISAFALTEPSAGSDTARVATRARLCSVSVEPDGAGLFRFTPVGTEEERVLLDAERLEFKPEGVFYRYEDNAASTRIEFDEYDYETDDPKRLRYFRRNGQKVYFSDIAYLRQRGGQHWYDYWELTGAKMWITNGRMSGIMALYAKTDLGVTGFIVDRHAEGLVVGKDEAKMGQNGSPTNELALQAVRVPKENVLGLEGRGQVNALETLNVGRAGLAMTSVSQMRTLVEIANSPVPAESPAAKWRCRRIEEETFLAESMAFYVIGLFEHPSTLSVRIESAAAKALVSELLHSSIELTEEALGLAGQTRKFLVEKRKRDARIINLYEGTNEIQRFLIIKELVTDVLPNWRPAATGSDMDPLSQQLASSMEHLRQRLSSAHQAFGNGLWQNPNLQPTVFHLSEAAMWLLAAYTVAGRIYWLKGRDETTKLPLGLAAFARSIAESERRLHWFDHEWRGVLSGRYAPTIRAADLLMDRQAHEVATEEARRSEIDSPLSILVILEPSVTQVPNPAIRAGRMMEAWWSLTAADEAALEQALRLRDAAPEQVRVEVAVVAGHGVEPLLRTIAAQDVATLRVDTPHDAIAPDQAVAALAHIIRTRSFDLLLGPAAASDGGEGVVTALAAAALNLPYHGSGQSIAVRGRDGSASLLLVADDGSTRQRALPGAVGITSGHSLRSYSVSGYLRGLYEPTEVHPWPSEISCTQLVWRSAQGAAKVATRDEMPERLNAQSAANLLLHTLGVQGDSTSSTAAACELKFEVGQGSCDIDDATALAVVACDATGRLSGSALAAVRAARQLDAAAVALLFSPAAEPTTTEAARALAAAGAARIEILVHDALQENEEIRARALLEAWPVAVPLPKYILGERWTELAFPKLRQRLESLGQLTLRVKRLTRVGETLEVETGRAGGKLSVTQSCNLHDRSTRWLSFTDDAEVPAPVATTAATVVVRTWSGQLDPVFQQPPFAQLLEELKAAAGVARLQDAEFILDVGYGVGNRDGYEAVIEPLEAALRRLGVKGLMIGGSRKVTEELHILPIDRQIGQSGVSVNPKILIAIGISGAPQHLQYIGARATILCFNKDPEAPMMTLNQRQPRPRVFPIVGDLFQTVPAFTQALLAEEVGTEPTSSSRSQVQAADLAP